MQITKIFLKDYRNFDELNLKPEVAINIFLGRNAQGKTNILEAVNFASLGRSRATKDFELVRRGEIAALIRINFLKADISHELAIEISASSKSRRVLLDGNEIKFRALVGKLLSVMFSPEDLFMFKNSPSVRRKFLDAEISQSSPIYFSSLVTYNRLVAERNNLLKKIREGLVSPANLDLWTEQLSIAAAKITSMRLLAIDKLNLLANAAHKKISSQAENFSVRYDFHGLQNFDRGEFEKICLQEEKLAKCYHDILIDRKFFDIKRGSTSLGPHLDDLQFFINGNELRLYGSQGQLRTAALSLKLADLQFLKSETGEYPILLLDDVMSELDADRREQLLNFLVREKIQTLITATEEAYFPPEHFGKIFYVESGMINV